MKQRIFLAFRAVAAAAAALFGIALACASEDNQGERGMLGVTTQALTACTTTAQCPGAQQCCSGFCRYLVLLGANDRLEYGCYAAQPEDNIGTPPAVHKVPDFSFAGYKMGGVAIPSAVFVSQSLLPVGNQANDSPSIQSYLDWCAAHGALCQVKLGPGTFYLEAPLRIRASNVVLRGAGQGAAGTVLISRIQTAHSLIVVGPDARPAYPEVVSGTEGAIVPPIAVGAKEVVVSGGGPWTSCTASTPCNVALVRTPNQAWVEDVHMDDLGASDNPWNPSSFAVQHVRRVTTATAVAGGTRLTLDIPVVDAIDAVYGGGYVAKINDGGFIENCGIEDLQIRSIAADDAPETCSNGALCACPDDGKVCTSTCEHGTCEEESCTGKSCTTSGNCGGGTCANGECQGGTCRRCRCKCQNPDPPQACVSACPAGLECRAGFCRCPEASGFCSNGQLCRRADGDWHGIALSRVKNSWVRRVTVRDYGMGAVALNRKSSFNTVEEVAHLDPRSPFDPETGLPKSGHRYSFQVGDGIGNLIQRCLTRNSRHSFVAGRTGTGPHVWLDSVAIQAKSDQGPHLRWSTGLLFDNIHSVGAPPASGELRVQNAHNSGSSHGWTGAQVMFWNSESPMVSDAPGGSMNWVVGGIGAKRESSKTPAEPFGIWQFSTGTVKPRSLYLQQLKDRLGAAAVEAVTTGPQRNGRLTKAMLKWQGNGKLSSYQDDPTCSTGTPSARSACCPKSCTVCGGSGVPSECLAGPIVTGTRSCLEFGPPCFRPDPSCAWGVPSASGSSCCPRTCTKCGGSGVPAECRTGSITRSCAEFPAPCRMIDPTCKAGVIAATSTTDTTPEYCCTADCKQCGGAGCSGAGTACCTGSITNSCATSMAPCTL